MEITVDALYVKAILLEGLKVATSCNKVNIGPSMGKAATEIASHTSGSINCDFHELSVAIMIVSLSLIGYLLDLLGINHLE